MKKEIIGLLLVLVLFAAGCGGTSVSTGGNTAGAAQGAQPTEEKAAGSGSPSKLSLNSIFDYGKVRGYEYKLTSAGNTVNMKYTISSDSVNGVDAWLQQSAITAQGSEVVTKMWLDKVTQKCLKITSSVKVNGQEMSAQETPCPTIGANAASNTKAPEFNYVGRESVTVPAGTFMADKYEGSGGQYWIGSKVPLPIKITSDNGNVVMELVSYS